MHRKALAASLLAASVIAEVGCAAGTEDPALTGQSEDALTSFANIASGGACGSPQLGRAPDFRNQFVRVLFEKNDFDDLAHVEWYDGKTGFRTARHTLGFQQKGQELELFSPDTVGTPFVMYRLRKETNGSVTLTSRDGLSALPVDCDLRKNAPNVKMAVAQAVASRKVVATGFPAPPEREGTCTSTKLVGGQVLRLGFAFGKMRAQSLNRFDDPEALTYINMPPAYQTTVELYTPKRFAEDVFHNAEVALVDETSKFGLAVVGPRGKHPVGYRYGEITAKTVTGKRVLVLKSADPELKAAVGAEVELACDF